MNRIFKKTMSLFLAAVLAVSLSAFAFAASGISVSPADTAASVAGDTITAYYSQDGCYVTLTATVDGTYSDPANMLYWVLPDTTSAHFKQGSSAPSKWYASQVANGTATATLYLDAAGSGISLKLGNTAAAASDIGVTPVGTAISSAFTLNIVQDTAEGVAVSPADPVTLGCGDSKTLTASVTYAHNTSVQGTSVTWASGDTSVASVSAGTVTASSAKTGQTSITASAGGATSEAVAVTVVPKVTISPSPAAVDEGVSTALTAAVLPGGTYTYVWTSDNAAVTVTGSGASASVRAGSIQSKSTANVTCAVSGAASGTCAVTAYPKADTIAIYDGASNVTGAAVAMNSASKQLTCTPSQADARGTATWQSSNTSVATVNAATGLVSAVTGANGTAKITCTYTNKDGTVVSAYCNVTVSVQTKTAYDVAMTATNHTDTSMSAAYTGIRNAYYSAYSAYPTATATISFTSVSNACGTLYKSSGSYGSGNIVSVGTGTQYALTDVQGMVFSPNTVGTERISYTVTSGGTGSATLNYLTGTIAITVRTAGSTVVVNLDGTDPYTFSYSTVRDGRSADAAIYSAIYSATGKSYYYLTFGYISSAAGTLYANYSGAAVTTGAPYYYSGSVNTASQLYYIPSGTGTYERSFTAYDVSGAQIFSGTLQLVVPSKPADASVSYSMTKSSALSMREADFTVWYQSQTSQSYYLSSVTFNSVKYSNTAYPGYFQSGGRTFTPGNGASYYTSTYNGTGNGGGNYLSGVTYYSPAITCYVTVDFTCYGGTNRNSEYLAKSGTMYICVTNGTVPDIKYTVTKSAGKTLSSNDFAGAYNAAMGTGYAGSFYVSFMNVPAKGALYAGYSSSAYTGITLTSANIGSYSFYVNYAGAGYTVDNVSYMPGGYESNTDTVKYAAYGINGQLLYIGDIDFVYGDGSGNVSYSDGYAFDAGDFYSASAADPVYSVAFTQPSVGKLYYNYSGGSGTQVLNTVKYYTKYSAYGSYPVSSVVYIPTVGYSGTVSIPYTATTAAGYATSGFFSVAVRSKTSSSTFYDVTPSNTGSWSANSVDFAARWGLVSGTDASHFSPTTNMSRGMLVSVLYKAAGSPNTSGSLPFGDVAYTDYYYRPVLWAYNNSTVGGKTTSSFAPDEAVTREQFVSMLYSYAAYSGRDVSYGGSLYGYSDAGSISAYAKTAMQWAVYHGYISGTTYNRLSPQGRANRAQAVVMLHRFLTQ